MRNFVSRDGNRRGWRAASMAAAPGSPRAPVMPCAVRQMWSTPVLVRGRTRGHSAGATLPCDELVDKISQTRVADWIRDLDAVRPSVLSGSNRVGAIVSGAGGSSPCLFEAGEETRPVKEGSKPPAVFGIKVVGVEGQRSTQAGDIGEAAFGLESHDDPGG